MSERFLRAVGEVHSDSINIPLTTGPIAKSFWGNEEMGDLILDGIVCVVDCRNILKVSKPLGCLLVARP